MFQIFSFACGCEVREEPSLSTLYSPHAYHLDGYLTPRELKSDSLFPVLMRWGHSSVAPPYPQHACTLKLTYWRLSLINRDEKQTLGSFILTSFSALCLSFSPSGFTLHLPHYCPPATTTTVLARELLTASRRDSGAPDECWDACLPRTLSVHGVVLPADPEQPGHSASQVLNQGWLSGPEKLGWPYPEIMGHFWK